MPKILITSGLGFIGSHTCIDLLNKGYEINIVDSLINSSIEILSNKKKDFTPQK